MIKAQVDRTEGTKWVRVVGWIHRTFSLWRKGSNDRRADAIAQEKRVHSALCTIRRDVEWARRLCGGLQQNHAGIRRAVRSCAIHGNSDRGFGAQPNAAHSVCNAREKARPKLQREYQKKIQSSLSGER